MFSSSLLSDQPTYVMNDSKVKDWFALGAPLMCTEKLSMMFQDQLVMLNEIVKSEQDLETAENKVHPAQKEIVHTHWFFYRPSSLKSG